MRTPPGRWRNWALWEDGIPRLHEGCALKRFSISLPVSRKKRRKVTSSPGDAQRFPVCVMSTAADSACLVEVGQILRPSPSRVMSVLLLLLPGTWNQHQICPRSLHLRFVL
ncbi:unnamed protein product [Pleuronectes platessa]|uniref:Uncharacterized protein n=1 Tax=Pleuronectes platessa TaxID=8262 RepID=A0A9N7V7S4_PLEPL|nr:unnamed protein product [Pleuronectes platessa]